MKWFLKTNSTSYKPKSLPPDSIFINFLLIFSGWYDEFSYQQENNENGVWRIAKWFRGRGGGNQSQNVEGGHFDYAPRAKCPYKAAAMAVINERDD